MALFRIPFSFVFIIIIIDNNNIIIIARVSHIRARERKSVGASPIYELNAA